MKDRKMSHLENCSKRCASGLVRVDSTSCMNVGRVILVKSVDKLETSVKPIPLKTPLVESTDASERSTARKASRVCIRRVWKVERLPKALLLLRTQLKGVRGATNMKKNCETVPLYNFGHLKLKQKPYISSSAGTVGCKERSPYSQWWSARYLPLHLTSTDSETTTNILYI